RFRRLRGVAVGDAALTGDPAHDRLEDVCLVVRHHALEDGGRAFDSHTRVDVLHRERRELPVRVELELHEDEVPELDEALAPRAAGFAVRLAAAVLDAAVVVHLRVRPARARAADRPEVLLPWEEDDPLHRLADLLPLPEGDLVLPEPELRIAGEHGDPEPLGV